VSVAVWAVGSDGESAGKLVVVSAAVSVVVLVQ